MSVRIAFVLAALVLAGHSVLLRAGPVPIMSSYSGPNGYDGRIGKFGDVFFGSGYVADRVMISCCGDYPPGSGTVNGVFDGFTGYTYLPVGPGLMTLIIYSDWDEDSRWATGSVSGSVVSLADPSNPVTLYSWNSPTGWISQTATFPIELNTSFTVNLSASINVGTGYAAGGLISEEVRISAADVPEPAALGLVCSGLATCYLLRKRARGTNA